MEVQKLQRYDLIERIAAGGMGEVYRARALGPLGFEKTLAVKRILPELSSDREFVERFVRESKLAVSLSHANLVQVFDLGRAGEDLFLVMEYVHGADLSRLLQAARSAAKRIPIPLALLITAEAAQGLAFAHGRAGPDGDSAGAHHLGVIHCDISPSNILLSYAGEVKLTDFGVAQLVDRSRHTPVPGQQLMGKWRYMAPEQIRGEPVDARTDLYALGVVLYEVLTGQRAFAGDGVKNTCDLVLTGGVAPVRTLRPEVPASLERFLQRLMAVEPRERPVDARTVLMQLAEIQAELASPLTALDLGALVRELLPPHPEPTQRGGLAALLQPVVVERSHETGTAVVRRSAPAASFTARTDSTSSEALTQWIPAAPPLHGGALGSLGLLAHGDHRMQRRVALGLALGLTLLSVGGVALALRLWRGPAPPRGSGVNVEVVSGVEHEAGPASGRPAGSNPASDNRGGAAAPASDNRGTASTPASDNRGAEAAPAIETVPQELGAILSGAPPKGAGEVAPKRQAPRGPGFLDIYAEPWANITIDGRPLSQPTPLVHHPVKPGPHKVLLQNPVLKRHKAVDVTVTEGQVQKVEVYLREAAP